MKYNDQYDVIVAGGGLSGVFAAVACARENLKVLLIERYGFLGGMATSGLVNPFMQYFKVDDNGNEIVVNNAGLFQDLIDRLAEKQAMKNKTVFNEQILKIVLDELIIENNIDVLFHSFVFDLETKDNKISCVKTAGKSGVQKYFANYFIDATGDADLAYLSGCNIEVGRKEDGFCQPMTTCFRIWNPTPESTFTQSFRASLNELYNKAQKDGKIKNPRENVLIFSNTCPDLIHFNSTRIVGKSALDVHELSAAELEGRKQVYELFTFLKENVEDYKDAQLVQIAPQIGVRESRRVITDYVISSDDILDCVKFEDSIARGCYCIDVHNPAGTGTVIKHIKGDYYTIPLKCVIAKEVENLAIAGRPISCDHEAHSALRVLPIVSSIGEGVGCAVSIAAKKAISLKDVDYNDVHDLLTKHQGAF